MHKSFYKFNWKYLFFVFLFLISLLSCQKTNKNINVIPKPSEISYLSGEFLISPTTVIMIDAGNSELKKLADFFVEKIKLSGGPSLTIKDYTESISSDFIRLTLRNADQELGKEGYKLAISSDKTVLKANAGNGLFYGLQTLFQLFPPEIEKLKNNQLEIYKIPCLEISDKPRFIYRGMHLDVGRHMFPVEFIKKYIDILASYKMNTFHWHLTEDQGWRIEIRKYPKLTQISSMRKGTQVLRSDSCDNKPYGGFYSREQAREIVRYASERYINVIPEIEMPGHSVAALAAYPQLSCTGGPFEVRWKWGISDDIYCAGNDSTFKFLENVLSEIIDIFPSKYIHIGGDEAPKARWDKCPKCQKRIKDENLKNEFELQSYFIRRIEKFINSKGRKLIGWDEILEGGLAPSATVMSWRGVEGGIHAAKLKHDVIMTPVSYCYFDYYQADPQYEPLAIGGFLTLKKVYSYEPVPEKLNAEETKYILGAQGNVWTEYMNYSGYVEYMAVPRMIALSEVVWTPKESKNWEDFNVRLQDHFKRLTYRNINYGKGSFKVGINTFQVSGKQALKVNLLSEVIGGKIHYTTDGKTPDSTSKVFTGPFEIDSSKTIKAGIFIDGKLMERITERPVYFHKGIGAQMKLILPYNEKYPSSGEMALLDGIKGTKNLNDGSWQGFEGNDMEVLIDLGNEFSIDSISIASLQRPGSYIFLPRQLEFSVGNDSSKLEKPFVLINNISTIQGGTFIHTFTQPFKGKKARFIRIKAVNTGKVPAGQEGTGEKAWLFADEIIIR